VVSIGIIANPASGKDIRRLVSYATVIDNNEKLNIVKRIVLAAQALGVTDIYFMPDTFCMGLRVEEDLAREKALLAHCHVLDIPMTASQRDTVRAAEEMEALGVGCIVALGGDGTSRAVAKSIVQTPLLPVSTGTNNVYPRMLEGTVAGMAAAAVALSDTPKLTCLRDKRIELYRKGELADIALIDVVISTDMFIGARAIWDAESIRKVIVTRVHPASIGFSAIAGGLCIIRPEEDLGCSVDLSEGGTSVLVPIAAGLIQEVSIKNAEVCHLDTDLTYRMEQNCVAALDGEREITLKQGDELTVRITRKGPWRVDVNKTLEQAQERGLFRK
jgi:predicted polyphosphate/ATP-dependent NAD kinase